MTPTPLNAKPQGAQSPDQLREIAIGLLHPSGNSLSDKETAGYINDLAEAAERIEKLERALAEARRDAERLDWLESNCYGHAYPRGKPYAMVKIFIKHDREEQKFLRCHASNGVGRVSLRTAIDATRQPEKDANNE